MRRPTKPDEILAMPDTERDAYAAEVCMEYYSSMNIDGEKQYIEMLDDRNGRVVHKFEPSQPTQKGKAQCWNLADKFGLVIMFEENKVMWRGKHGEWHQIAGKLQTEDECQSTTVTAAILCALAEKEK